MSRFLHTYTSQCTLPVNSVTQCNIECYIFDLTCEQDIKRFYTDKQQVGIKGLFLGLDYTIEKLTLTLHQKVTNLLHSALWWHNFDESSLLCCTPAGATTCIVRLSMPTTHEMKTKCSKIFEKKRTFAN